MSQKPVRSSRNRRRRIVIATIFGLVAAVAGWLWLGWLWLGPADDAGDDRGAKIAPAAGAASGIDGKRADAEALTRDPPDGLRLDRLVERDEEIVLCGWAFDLGAIADWIERLDQARIFANVELRQVTGHPAQFEPGYSFVIGLNDVVPPRPRRWIRHTSDSPAGSAASRIECAATGTNGGDLDRLPVLEPSCPAPGPPRGRAPGRWHRSLPACRCRAATWLAATLIEELEIVGVYRTSLGPVARARSSRHDGVLAVQVGDRLNDGEIIWIGFLSEERAAVRLKQLVWPPIAGETYREIERIVDLQGSAR